MNSTLSDIATALTASIAKDGQTTPTANLPMGTFRHTGVGAAAARTDYARAAEVQDGAMTHLTSVLGADTITATAGLSMTAYATGQKFTFVSAGANTGAATLNINSIGAKAIKKLGTTALAAGDIPSGSVAEVVYDGTNFQLTTIRFQEYDADIATVSASQAEMEAGTEAALRSVSPLRVAQAIAALASNLPAASQAEQEAGSSTVKTVTPGRQQFHPSSAKAWINFNGTGTPAVRASYNMDGSTPITDNGTGDYTLNIGTDMSSASYAVAMAINSNPGSTPFNAGVLYGAVATDVAAGSVRIKCQQASSASDLDWVNLVFFGDQA